MRIEDIAVGATAAISRTVTDADIRAFAAATGDDNPVHLDDAAAARSIFGGRVAHGMLGAGLISAVLGTKLPGPGTIYLAQSLRFTKPVRIGDTITASVQVLEVLAPKRRVRLATRCSNQRGELVLDGEATVMVPDE
ncbi:MAG TPA: MaoC family dehydratase [Gemmatimonadaceae bacterium]|nr:MaoC family dehydratase [Gemmatimonadaceae bacterium]